MSSRLRHALPLVLAAGVLAVPAAAIAEERDCRGAIGAETVDNLRVPQGESCELTGTRVKGTVKVERDAVLRATNIEVIGNVQSENGAQVTVGGSRIGGSVQVKQGGGASVTDSAVTGDVQYDQNTGALEVSRNRVNGNVQVIGNRAQASIFDNTIEANLQCKENEPPPVGGRNAVKGSAEDPCVAFAGGPGAPSGGGPSGSGSGGDDSHRAVSPVEARSTVLSLRGARRGTLLRLSGRAVTDQRSLAGLTVTIQVRRADGWRRAKRVTTGDDGRYRTSLRLRRGSRLVVRAVVKRQAGFPATRASTAITVRPRR